jgi:CheY-like chemotaxis protein
MSGLLISNDLFFTSKVTGTAAQLGSRCELVGSQSLALERLATVPYRAVFIDLAHNGLDLVALVTAARTQSPAPRVIAFGSHVAVDRLDEARTAGCDDVMPRSRFSGQLPDILRATLLATSDTPKAT